MNERQIKWEIKNRLGIEPTRQTYLFENYVDKLKKQGNTLGDTIVNVWKTDLNEREKLLVLGFVVHVQSTARIPKALIGKLEGIIKEKQQEEEGE